MVRGALDAGWIGRLHRAFVSAPVQEGGTRHVRISEDTPEREAWRALEGHEALLDAAALVLGQGPYSPDAHGRDPLPGFGQQGLHADWPARPPGTPPMVLTALFMLDPFTALNGATRVVPGTHTRPDGVPRALAQPRAHHPDERVITGDAGDVLLFNGHLWHSGRKNNSAGSRRTVQLVLRRAGLRA